MSEKVCQHCGAAFKPYNKVARCCSEVCSQKQRYKKYKEAGKDFTAYQYEGYARRKYKLSLQDIEEMLQKQNYCCSVCSIPQESLTDKRKKLFIDHDHTTGKVRGLLCGPCNSMLGMAKDNIETLARAIAYLESHK